jgi:hypothetical protein
MTALRDKIGTAIRQCRVCGGSAEEQADVALAAIDAAGWQCVPREPTDVMIEEGCAVDCTRSVCKARLECRDQGGKVLIHEKWESMLAAAPKARPK